MKFNTLLLLATSNVFAAPTVDPLVLTPSIINECDRPGFISLTFNDGPAENTDTLLAQFKTLGTKATFFVNAQYHADFTDPNSEAAKKLLRIYQAGHQIATHGFSHKDFTKLSRQEIEEELCKNDAAIEAIIGQRPRQLRLPYLASNETVLQIVNELGYIVIGGNLDNKEWDFNQANTADPALATIESSDNTTQSFITVKNDFETGIDLFAKDFSYAGWRNGYRFRTVAQCIDSEPYRNPTNYRNPKDFPTNTYY